LRNLLRIPSVYRAWQAPFVAKKLAPFLARHDPRSLGQVIDIGCGPGTNSSLFAPDQYLGVDLSPAYVDAAKARNPSHEFRVWDVRTPSADVGSFDLAFVNSVFHHLSDDESRQLLDAIKSLVKSEGLVAIIDLVLPERPSMAWMMARLDRGEHPRSLTHWQAVFEPAIEYSVLEEFPVGLGASELWRLVYCEGRPRASAEVPTKR
jgi:SAM-dependent methyltransferase